MRRYNLATQREAVNFALRMAAHEPLDLETARSLRGSGWDADLAENEVGSERMILIDCLIAAAAIDAGLPVLHCDSDFDVLARHTPLEVAG